MMWKFSVSKNNCGSSTAKLTGLIAGLFLSGCSTTTGQTPCSYDFRDQGFFGAAGSVATSEYQRCTDHLLAQLTELQVKASGAARDAKRLEVLAEKTVGEEREAVLGLAAVNRESQAALDDLNRLRASRKTNQNQLNDLIRKQAEMEEKKNSLSNRALSGQAATLNAQIVALKRQQDALRNAIREELSS